MLELTAYQGYQHFVYLSHEIKLVLNPETTLIYFSHSLPDLLKYRPDDLKTIRFLSLVHPDDRDSVSQCFTHSSKNVEPLTFTCRFIARDMKYVWISWRMKAFTEAYYLIGTDVTERIQLEKEIEGAKLKALNSVKLASLGKLTADISSELYGLIKEVNIQIEALKEAAPPSGAEKLDTTLQKATRVVKGLNSLLSNEKTEFEHVKLNELIHDVLLLCEKKFQQHNVRLAPKMPESDVLLDCCPVQISQVLMNLLSNACDAFENDKGNIIEIEVKGSTKSNIKIRISNNGKPISKENRKSLFKPFFSTKSHESGTGLGLSISKNIIMAHRGDIELDEAHEMTCFVVSIPKRRK